MVFRVPEVEPCSPGMLSALANAAVEAPAKRALGRSWLPTEASGFEGRAVFPELAEPFFTGLPLSEELLAARLDPETGVPTETAGAKPCKRLSAELTAVLVPTDVEESKVEAEGAAGIGAWTGFGMEGSRYAACSTMELAAPG
jgi:hypothetical protein